MKKNRQDLQKEVEEKEDAAGRTEHILDKACIEKIKAVTVDDLLEVYALASSVGHMTRKAKVRPQGLKYLEQFLDELRADLDKEGMEPTMALAVWIKKMIWHRPFSDANRRAIFEFLQAFLRLCGYEIEADENEYTKIGGILRTMSEDEIHSFIRERARSIDRSLSK